MLTHIPLMPRQHQLRPDILQRLEHKTAQMQTRMRNDEHRIITGKISRIQEIQIQGSRRILLTNRRTSHLLLDGLKMRMQLTW